MTWCPDHTWRMGLQSKAEALMKIIPFLDTVAGEALSMLCTSNRILQFGAIGIRSPLANVRVLLSSSTEFKFSIHTASTGPSRMIHTCSPGKHINNKLLYSASTYFLVVIQRENKGDDFIRILSSGSIYSKRRQDVTNRRMWRLSRKCCTIRKWRVTFFDFEWSPPKCGKNSICPVICGHIQSSKHLRCCNGLWIHSHFPTEYRHVLS